MCSSVLRGSPGCVGLDFSFIVTQRDQIRDPQNTDWRQKWGRLVVMTFDPFSFQCFGGTEAVKSRNRCCCWTASEVAKIVQMSHFLVKNLKTWDNVCQQPTNGWSYQSKKVSFQDNSE